MTAADGVGEVADSDGGVFLGRSMSASLTVSDLDASLVWYRDVLCFAVERLHEREGRAFGASLRAGDVRLFLTQDDGSKGLDRIKGDGFSLMITTSQDVDQVAGRIKERGGTLESEPVDTPWGGRLFRVRDPDGFRLAIATERPVS
ncbi:MAG: VOC family protein [Longimicrobiales bacterium]